MEKLQKILAILPGVDCGLCGSPNCQALAEDVVNGDASLRQCIFLQKKRVAGDKTKITEAGKILDAVWGKNIFDGRAIDLEE
nr:(Fe-S)-binding protein [Desulfoluna sp.]